MPRRGSHLGSLTWLCSSASDSGSDSPLALGARSCWRFEFGRNSPALLKLLYFFILILFSWCMGPMGASTCARSS